MLLFHIIILALVQGLTEFLPISSSGHLLFAHELLGHDSRDAWAENLSLDIAVHVGTLAAVLLYFRKDVMSMITGVFKSNETPSALSGRKLALYVIIGSLPVVIAGFILYALAPPFLRSLEIMAWMTLIFGIVLGVADKLVPPEKEFDRLTLKDAFLIGLAQILALIPGTSRSGITMTAARFLGFDRQAAARFSLLLAIIAISGAGILGGADIFLSGNLTIGFDILLATLFAFVSGWAAIAVMMKWLERSSFMPFVIYRVILASALLIFLYI